MEKLYYAGVGSRRTPSNIQNIMKKLSYFLEKNSFILRSGGATGADKAFQQGVENKENMEIYLPYKGFNNNVDGIILDKDDERYTKLAREVHPLGNNLPESTLKYHRRNCAQILGIDLKTPVKFVLCWTSDGCESNKTTKETGGTGQAIRLAAKYKIPIINLYNKEWKTKLIDIYNRCTFVTLFE